jgi:hypothetical protein
MLWMIAACLAVLLGWQTDGAFIFAVLFLFLFWGMPFTPAVFRRRQ